MRSIDLSQSLTIEDVLDVAHQRATAHLGPVGRQRVARAHAVVTAFVSQHDTPRYGINTGFGALAEVVIADSQLSELQQNLVRSHACGVGAALPEAVVRAMILLRAQVLAAGHSGVRPVVIDALCALLDHKVHPIVPCQGSVGASGDLAPLAHLALVLLGEGEASHGGLRMPAGAALSAAGLEPLQLQAKEGLSLINGTQAMTALAVVALGRSEQLCRAADICGAMTVEAQLATDKAFDPRIVAVRPYPGALTVAANLRALTAGSPLVASHAGPEDHKVQDPYSIRCMPQVHGAVRDALRHVREVLTIEIAAVTDNPLIFVEDGEDPQQGAILSGGNFHGQPVAIACDLARTALASLASMAERRIEQLVNPALNSGLPAFLARHSGLNSGFMMAQVTAAALVSESKGLCMPSSVDSIPSSANREDHVSMGPIAARRWLDVVQMAEQVVAIEWLCAAQGLDLRAPLQAAAATSAAHRRLREVVPPLTRDRILYRDIEAATALLRDGVLEQAVRAVLLQGQLQ
jgi:histidine ammonia-lyase